MRRLYIWLFVVGFNGAMRRKRLFKVDSIWAYVYVNKFYATTNNAK